MIRPRKNPCDMVSIIENWLKIKAEEAHCAGAVLGLSGGIDSAVVSVLLRRVFGMSMLAVKMPCHSLSIDGEHSDLVIKAFDLPWTEIDLSETYDSLLKALGMKDGTLACANIKPRLRMTSLYALAQDKGFLVCGTSNKSELTVGYFTKHGDSGTDLLPLGDLTKTEVREIARYLEIPGVILEKPPSAGLWEGQTDEEEMGITYDDIDRYILSDKECSAEEKIKSRYLSTAHKRQMPPICPVF